MLNRAYPGALLRSRLRPAPAAERLIDSAVAVGRLSARGADRVLRVAWSLTDLGGADRPGLDHVGQALTLRCGADGG